MARPRTQIQSILEDILGTAGKVYFQPANGLQLKYPCITYELSGDENVKADNISYLRYKRYTVTCISRNPDTVIPDKLMDSFEHCSYDRRFVSDNLYHDVITIYF